MKVLFLGQNPSRVSPDTAFFGTKSGDRLLSWIDEASLPLNQVDFANILDEATQDNKPLKLSQVMKVGRDVKLFNKLRLYDIVYVCGKQAETAVRIAVEHFDLSGVVLVFLPHPSGLNRKLNNKAFVRLTIHRIKSAYESTLLKKMAEDNAGMESADSRNYRHGIQGQDSSRSSC